MKRMVFLLVTLLSATALAEHPSVRYRAVNPYARKHFYMGVEGLASLRVHETGRAFVAHGGGFNLFIGGRIHRNLALEFGWAPTFQGQPGPILGHPFYDGVALSALTADLKVFFARHFVQPYFTVGPGVYFLHDWAFNYYAGGGGWQIGGGIDFWVLPVLSLGIKAQYRGATLLDYNQTHENTYLSFVTLGANLTGHF